MQAAVSTTRFGFGGLKNALVAGVFAAGLAIGVASPHVIDYAPWRHASGAATVAPRAYVNLNLGEGLLSRQTVSTMTQLKAYSVAGQGEGIVGGNRNMTAVVTATVNPGAGEGWVANGRPAATLPLAHVPAGAGEGWLENGRP